MQNNFYTNFDITRLRESRRNDYRSIFQIDRDRIIYSSEFRRLQGKTQVFLPGEFDFYRTRLTHSIEVAQIGRSICNYLLKMERSPFNDNFYIDPDLIESISLAHDLGHPPFGHAGERTLNKLMKKHGGFEGNAQTLRLLTEIFYRGENSRRGMNPSRSLIDGVLKYKSLFRHFDNPKNHFLYDHQEKYLDFVFDSADLYQHFSPGKEANSFSSIECQIMDWADDTSYAINDIVDSISAGFITIIKLIKWLDSQDNLSTVETGYVEELIEWLKKGEHKRRFGTLVGTFIQTCKIEERENFFSDKSNRYRYELVIDEEIKRRANIYKRLSVELVFFITSASSNGV